MKAIKIFGVIVLCFASSIGKTQIKDNASIVAEDAKVELLGDGFIFTEGPAADKNGNVYFTDQPNNKIHKWSDSTNEISVFVEESGRSNGLYFTDDGHLLACADMDNQLLSFDQSGKPKVLVEAVDERLLNGPNDLWVDHKGGIYFTDPLYKRDYWTRDPEMQQDGQHVYYLSPDRQKLTKVDTLLVKPNGIVGTANGKNLYVADIGDDKTYVYDISKDGSLSKRTLFTEKGSDGMTIDHKGNVYLTGKGVTVFNKKGKEIAHIPIEKDWTANVCFGGAKNKILFITAKEAVYGLKMNVKGVR
jgi:gluconolactonase